MVRGTACGRCSGGQLPLVQQHEGREQHQHHLALALQDVLPHQEQVAAQLASHAHHIPAAVRYKGSGFGVQGALALQVVPCCSPPTQSLHV